jgi:hypothetical protein
MVNAGDDYDTLVEIPGLVCQEADSQFKGR